MPRNRKVIDADYYEDENTDNNIKEKKEDSNIRSHRRRRRDTNDSANSNRVKESAGKDEAGINGLDLSKIDFGQVADLMKKIDISQISSMLSGLGGLGNLGGSASEPTKNEGDRSQGGVGGGRRVELLNAIRPMVTPQRADLIDVIMQLYSISKILRK